MLPFPKNHWTTVLDATVELVNLPPPLVPEKMSPSAPINEMSLELEAEFFKCFGLILRGKVLW